jgi:hypothetical protein
MKKQINDFLKIMWGFLLILLIGFAFFVGTRTIGPEWTGVAFMASITLTALIYGKWAVFAQVPTGTMGFKNKGQEFIEIIYASIFKSKLWKFFGVHFVGWVFRNENIKTFDIDIAKLNKSLNEKKPETWILNEGKKRTEKYLRKMITRFIRVQVKLADGMDVYIGVAFVFSVVDFLNLIGKTILGGREFVYTFNASFTDPQNFLTGHVRDKAAEVKTYKDLIRDAGTLLNDLKKHYYDYSEYDENDERRQVPLITENEETEQKKLFAQFEKIEEELVNFLFDLKNINDDETGNTTIQLEQELEQFREEFENLKNTSEEEIPPGEELLDYKKGKLRKYITNLRLSLKNYERKAEEKSQFKLILESFNAKFKNIEKEFSDPILQEELKDFGFLLNKIEIVAHHPVNPKVLEAAEKKQIAEMELEAILVEVKGKKELAQVELESIAQKAKDLFDEGGLTEEERAKYVFSYLERRALPEGLTTLIMDVIKNK